MTTLFVVILAIGILNTLYLSYHAVRGTRVACLFLPPESCTKVNDSKYSRTMSIRNPYLGLGMLIAISALYYLHLDNVLPVWPVQALVSFGFLFSMYFLYIQAVILRAYCTWCVVSAIVFTALFLVQWTL